MFWRLHLPVEYWVNNVAVYFYLVVGIHHIIAHRERYVTADSKHKNQRNLNKLRVILFMCLTFLKRFKSGYQFFLHEFKIEICTSTYFHYLRHLRLFTHVSSFLFVRCFTLHRFFHPILVQ